MRDRGEGGGGFGKYLLTLTFNQAQMDLDSMTRQTESVERIVSQSDDKA